MKSLLSLLLLMIAVGFMPTCHAMENTFYILHSKHPDQFLQQANESLKQHHRDIHLLISQAYHIDAQGNVTGYIDPAVLSYTRQHGIRELAMITNSSYDPVKAHRFLSNPEAQRKAIASLVALCQQLQFTGVQFDFEGISVKDRDAFTQFISNAAHALHQNLRLVSVAVVPLEEDGQPPTTFLKRRYENWSGAYDLQALAKSADFITIMSYDQHGEGATPGPTASIDWVDATVRYALKYVPANKLSLGIPVYSGHWYTGTYSDSPKAKISVHLDNIRYDQVQSLLARHKLQLQWDNHNKIDYVMYEHNWLYEYIFAEDARSFQAKRALAKKYHLRGISVFDLGSEDPQIWKVLASR